MSPDTIEIFHNQTIQHGKSNDRIYLMKFNLVGSEGVPAELIKLAEAKGYSKVFVKVPADYAQAFRHAGFEDEARIPGFYKGHMAAKLLGYYLSDERHKSASPQANEDVMKACREKQAQNKPAAELPEGFNISKCTPDDAEAMARIYDVVFDSYPFPIFDPAYIRETMADNVYYFGVRNADGKLIALSSAEVDNELKNAEMTDFATLPEARGQSLASVLLAQMEEVVQAKGIITAYTIARAASFGMNITFATQGYEFGGRLIRNTQIGGSFEDMNVWYKTLPARR
ncbi:MAG: putative beta-lysine N-acetyltransferase [Phycisphaerae bacterium]|jgi:putative beta-lysine N-acetyltransferase